TERCACARAAASLACPAAELILHPGVDRQPASVHHHRADRLAALHQLEAFVDLLELQAVRDQLVDVELAFHVPVDDARHVGAAACAAERRALPDTAGDAL